MRLLHRLYARLFGYFWLPCPACGKMFGGHECGDKTILVGGRSMITCGCGDLIPLSFKDKPLKRQTPGGHPGEVEHPLPVLSRRDAARC